jgi:hypothetical protein
MSDWVTVALPADALDEPFSSSATVYRLPPRLADTFPIKAEPPCVWSEP